MDLAAYLGTIVAITTVAVAGMHALLRTIGGRFDDMNNRFDDLHRRFDDITRGFNSRFDDVDRRFDDVDRRFDDVTNGINRRIDDLRTDLGGRIDRIERRLDMVPGIALEPDRDG